MLISDEKEDHIIHLFILRQYLQSLFRNKGAYGKELLLKGELLLERGRLLEGGR